MNCFSSHRGATLIELLVALTILAILAGIALPAYNNYITTSRNTEGWNNLANIKLAQEEYFLENNRYFPDPDGTAQTSDNSINAYWLPAEQTDAERNFDYAVTTSSGGTSYTATATGRGAGYDVPNTVSFSVTK